MVGLYRFKGTSRWRITLPGEHFGKRFTEVDERLAVAKFKALVGEDATATIILDTLPRDDFDQPILNENPADTGAGFTLAKTIDSTENSDGTISLVQRVNEQEMWNWCRRQILADPVHAARMTGITALSHLRHDIKPQADLKLDDLIAVYKRQNPASDKSKREALAALRRLIDNTQAKTLDDLTQDALLRFKEKIEKDVPGPATRAAYYNRIRFIIRFGLKVGLDPVQIRACLDRAKVLWTGEAMPSVQPKPISREHFHALLQAGNGSWRAWLLVGLNLCMSIEEVCGLRWEWFDLEKGTFACVRVKTRRKRIPRAAVLWPETIRALKAIDRKGPYVFVSSHGTRYNKNTRVNDFKEFKEAAGLPDLVTFSCLRDGAYTAAAHGTTDERQARVLAGHVAPGLSDNYVLRNAEIVKPACDAVYMVYGPFPITAAIPEDHK